MSGLIGNYIDYWASISNSTPNADTGYYSAYGNNSLLASFPGSWADSSGLPILGALNDGSANGCSGNIMIVQLVRLADSFTTPAPANTNITKTNCFTSYGTVSGDENAPSATWNGNLTGGGGNQHGTWKGMVLTFVGNLLYGCPYRQTSAGGFGNFGDSTCIMSPDAGANWIDYGHWVTSSAGVTITAATCSSTTATYTATNTFAGTNVVYIHDVVADVSPTNFNGMKTVATATGANFTVTVPSCTGFGTYTSGGVAGLMSTNGSAPLGPANGAYPANMMWQVAATKNPMARMSPISWGQDGSFPTPPDAGCDPATYICGISIDMTQSPAPMILWRVLVTKGMLSKADYQWYTCSGYTFQWPVIETTCDGNLAGSWTGTVANATIIQKLYATTTGGPYPREFVTMRYSSAHQAYILPGYNGQAPYRILYWAPHPWGPFYPITTGCADSVTCDAAFQNAMLWGEVIASTNPPATQIRFSSDGCCKGSGHPVSGTPFFWTVGLNSGRVPMVGSARRANFLDIQQLGMAHRLTSGPMARAIPIRGTTTAATTWSLVSWLDLFDHGGDANATSRTSMRDILSGGSTSYQITGTSGVYGNGAALAASGITMQSNGYLTSAANDTTLFPGNTSWTYMGVFRTGSSGATATALSSNATTVAITVTNGGTFYLPTDETTYTLSGGPGVCTTLTPTISGGVITAIAASGCSGWTVGGGDTPTVVITNFVQGAFHRPFYLLGVGATLTTTTGMQIQVGRDVSGSSTGIGNISISWGAYTGSTNPTQFAIPASSVAANTWYFLSVAAQSNGPGGGFPTLTVILCTAGTCTRYGGTSLATSGNGTSSNSLTKFCSSNCSTTPNIASGSPILLGSDTFQTWLNGTYGEMGLFSGAVPDNIVYGIYRTLRADWARTNPYNSVNSRGSL